MISDAIDKIRGRKLEQILCSLSSKEAKMDAVFRFSGEIYTPVARLDEAIAYFNEREDFYKASKLACTKGSIDEAVAILKEGSLKVGLGQSYLIEKAASLLEESNPKGAIELLEGIKNYRKAADIAERKGHLEQAQKLYGLAEEYNMAAKVAEKRGESQTAGEMYELAIKKSLSEGHLDSACYVALEKEDFKRLAGIFEEGKIKCEHIELIQKAMKVAKIAEERRLFSEGADILEKAELFLEAARLAKRRSLEDRIVPLYQKAIDRKVMLKWTEDKKYLCLVERSIDHTEETIMVVEESEHIEEMIPILSQESLPFTLYQLIKRNPKYVQKSIDLLEKKEQDQDQSKYFAGKIAEEAGMIEKAVELYGESCFYSDYFGKYCYERGIELAIEHQRSDLALEILFKHKGHLGTLKEIEERGISIKSVEEGIRKEVAHLEEKYRRIKEISESEESSKDKASILEGLACLYSVINEDTQAITYAKLALPDLERKRQYQKAEELCRRVKLKDLADIYGELRK